MTCAKSLPSVTVPDGYTLFFPFYVTVKGTFHANRPWARRNLGHGNHRNRRIP